MILIANPTLFRYELVEGINYNFLKIFMEPSYAEMRCKLTRPKVVLVAQKSNNVLSKVYYDLAYSDSIPQKSIALSDGDDANIREQYIAEYDDETCDSTMFKFVDSDSMWWKEIRYPIYLISAEPIEGMMEPIQKSILYDILYGSLLVAKSIDPTSFEPNRRIFIEYPFYQSIITKEYLGNTKVAYYVALLYSKDFPIIFDVCDSNADGTTVIMHKGTMLEKHYCAKLSASCDLWVTKEKLIKDEPIKHQRQCLFPVSRTK